MILPSSMPLRPLAAGMAVWFPGVSDLPDLVRATS